jgi:outer membrane receptor protein involved in Fe transport
MPLAVWLALAGLPASVRAEDQAQSSENTAAALAEVTVTATRREESLSKVPISVTALTEEALDDRGIKDFSEIARFTPGVNFDTSGTNNISIRGISGTGGAGTTGIYLDDTPIQMRALAFNPDEALPKSFDIDRVEVLRGPQGTLFGAGSEGGTVRYITTPPSLTKDSVYARTEFSDTEGGAPSYEAGVAAGGPLINGTLGARLSVWYRRDGGWVDDINPVTLQSTEKNANFVNTYLVRLALLWAPSEKWTATPSIYYQNQERNDINNYWPLYSNPGSDQFVDAAPRAGQVLSHRAQDSGGSGRGAADFQHLVLPSPRAGRLRGDTVQPRVLPGGRVQPGRHGHPAAARGAVPTARCQRHPPAGRGHELRLALNGR